MIVSIQHEGDPRKNNGRFLRAELPDDAGVEDVRKAVTAMMRKPSEYAIACRKFIDWTSVRRGPKSAPAVRGDEGEMPGVDATVERALAT